MEDEVTASSQGKEEVQLKCRLGGGGLLCTQQHFGWPHLISLKGFFEKLAALELVHSSLL